MRPVTIRPYPSRAPGSVIITQGQTRVLCTASIDEQPPKWIKTDEAGRPIHGWITAEYAMLPGSTPGRKKRGPDGRGTEIQRLIGRVLRAAVDLNKLPGVSITCDCDVLCADGGTRTASITGAFVALAQAVRQARRRGLIDADPILGPVAAVSVGIVDGRVVLDLDYDADSRAEVDLNVAMDHRGRFIEVQGTAERSPFTKKQLDAMLARAASGIRRLIAIQRRALAKGV